MKKNLKYLYYLLTVIALSFLLNACATTTPPAGTTAEIDQKIAELDQQKMELQKQKSQLSARETELAAEQKNLDEKLKTIETLESQKTAANSPAMINAPLLPPDAKPGECYARVFVPPTYKTITETRLKKAESSRIEIIPATYKMVEQEVLVSEASEKLKTIPAKYETQTKDVLVRDRELIWRTSLDQKSPEAGKLLLETAQKYGIDLASANPGDCFHEHYLPAKYETVYTDELVAEESYRIEVVPARYETVEEKVLVREASSELVNVPATYKYEEEQVLVKEAHTEWKKGRGLVEKIDNTTGEIMCLIEVPAEYKTVRKKVVDQPAHTIMKHIPAEYKTVKVTKMVAPASERKIAIPAKYKKVSHRKLAREGQLVWHEIHNMEHPTSTRTGNKICLTEIPATYRKASKKVVVEPAKTVAERIPAKYKTIKVKTLDTAARERKITIPAEYQQVTRQTKVSEGRLEWRRVLCETNTTSGLVSRLQSTLISKDYDPGPVDGVYGPSTAAAVKKYQMDKGLATGSLTMETLKSLGLF